MSLKRRRKNTRYRGWKSQGRGTKRKVRGSGHRGGVGLSGTGKRGDQKKTLVLNLYGNDYFGKDRALRRGRAIKKLHAIDLISIVSKLDSFIAKGTAKENKGIYEINLMGYKILGDADISLKLRIKASAASKSAIERVAKAGGEIVLPVEKEIVKGKKTEEPKK